MCKEKALFVISAVAVAQLGERQTEHMKVPGSIQGLGISSMYCVFGQCITYFSCRWGTIAHLNITKRYGNRFVIGCLAAWFQFPEQPCYAVQQPIARMLLIYVRSVSYTHLTLPTILLV